MHSTPRSIFVRYSLVAVLLSAIFQTSPLLRAQGLFQATPLIDGDTPGLYKDMHGHLYGHYLDVGYNTPDTMHDADGKNLGNTIALNPICHNGDKNNCKIVVVAIGMSHWTKELCHDQQLPLMPFVLNANCDPWTFIYKASHTTGVNTTNLVLVDCAQDGSPSVDWLDDTPRGPLNRQHYTDCENWMETGSGLNVYKDQVQVIIFKEADSGQRNTLTPIPPSVPGGGGFIGCPSMPVPTTDPDACVLLYNNRLDRAVRKNDVVC